jgi:hypothetical protein
MSTTKQADKSLATSADERVTVLVPRDGPNSDPNLTVGVNGVMFVIPKGVPTPVPPMVAAEVNRSIAAKNKFYDEFERREDAAKSPQ